MATPICIDFAKEMEKKHYRRGEAATRGVL